jgi:hypothetical protein
MDKERLDEYKRAIDELQEAVELLQNDTIDRAVADEKYRKAAIRCDSARAALYGSAEKTDSKPGLEQDQPET